MLKKCNELEFYNEYVTKNMLEEPALLRYKAAFF